MALRIVPVLLFGRFVGGGQAPFSTSTGDAFVAVDAGPAPGQEPGSLELVAAVAAGAAPDFDSLTASHARAPVSRSAATSTGSVKRSRMPMRTRSSSRSAPPVSTTASRIFW